MPAQLLSLSDGPSILIDKPIILVGRHEECDLQLNSRKVSRKHCCIAEVRDHLVIRDLGSTNGIRINGVRVMEGVLRTGDELTIGNFRYQVQSEGPRAAMPAAQAALPNRPVPRPVFPAEDDDLASVDVPVPLSDHGGPRPPTARAAPGPPGGPPVAVSDSRHQLPKSSSFRPPA